MVMTNTEEYTNLGEDIIRAKNRCSITHEAWTNACKQLYAIEKRRNELWNKIKNGER